MPRGFVFLFLLATGAFSYLAAYVTSPQYGEVFAGYAGITFMAFVIALTERLLRRARR